MLTANRTGAKCVKVKVTTPCRPVTLCVTHTYTHTHIYNRARRQLPVLYDLHFHRDGSVWLNYMSSHTKKAIFSYSLVTERPRQADKDNKRMGKKHKTGHT